mgnify:CR=1 FL=1
MAARLNSDLTTSLASTPRIGYRIISQIRVGFLPEGWVSELCGVLRGRTDYYEL